MCDSHSTDTVAATTQAAPAMAAPATAAAFSGEPTAGVPPAAAINGETPVTAEVFLRTVEQQQVLPRGLHSAAVCNAILQVKQKMDSDGDGHGAWTLHIKLKDKFPTLPIYCDIGVHVTIDKSLKSNLKWRGKEILTKEEYYSTAIAMVQEAQNGEMSLAALKKAMGKKYHLNASILRYLLQSSVAIVADAMDAVAGPSPNVETVVEGDVSVDASSNNNTNTNLVSSLGNANISMESFALSCAKTASTNGAPISFQFHQHNSSTSTTNDHSTTTTNDIHGDYIASTAVSDRNAKPPLTKEDVVDVVETVVAAEHNATRKELGKSIQQSARKPPRQATNGNPYESPIPNTSTPAHAPDLLSPAPPPAPAPSTPSIADPPVQAQVAFSHGTTPSVVGAGAQTELFPASPSRSVGLPSLVEMPSEAAVFVAQTDMLPKQILPAPAWVVGEASESHFAAILSSILDMAKLKFESMTSEQRDALGLDSSKFAESHIAAIDDSNQRNMVENLVLLLKEKDRQYKLPLAILNCSNMDEVLKRSWTGIGLGNMVLVHGLALIFLTQSDHDENASDMSDFNSTGAPALGYLAGFEVEVTLNDEDESFISICVAAFDVVSAAEAFSKVVQSIATLGSVSTVSFCGASSKWATLIPSSTTAMTSLLGSASIVAFSRVNVMEDLQERLCKSTAQLQFDNCKFESNGRIMFCDEPRFNGSFTPPLQATFQSDELPSFGFLTKAVRRGRFNSIVLDGCIGTQTELVDLKILQGACTINGCTLRLKIDGFGLKFDNGHVANLGSADVRKVATGEYTIDRWLGHAVGGTALEATTSKVVKDVTTETGSILAATKNRSNQSNKGVSFVVFSLVFVFAFHWLSLFAAIQFTHP